MSSNTINLRDIKKMRLERHWSQDQLAEMSGLSIRTIQRIEKGEVDPRAYSLQMIAKALDVDFSLFVENESIVDNDKKAKDKVRKFDWIDTSQIRD